MRLFERLRRNAARAPINPSEPHTFRFPDDPGMGAAAAGAAGSAGGRGGPALGMNAALTGNFRRGLRCGVPGCGRERDDAIHFPEG
jgi:hypothetical protein